MLKKGIIFDWEGTLSHKEIGLFPNVKEIIERLSEKYSMSLITKTSDFTRRRNDLKNSGIEKYLLPIIICRDKTIEDYQHCMRKMGTLPETTLVVDDRTVRGIKIGNQLGMQTCWITSGVYQDELPNQDTGEPTYRIQNISGLELIEFFK